MARLRTHGALPPLTFTFFTALCFCILHLIYVMKNVRMTVDDELVTMWKEAVVAFFRCTPSSDVEGLTKP